MATFTSTLTMVHKVQETLTTTEQPLVDTADNTVQSSLSGSRTSTAASSPSISAGAAFAVTMSGGAATVDLTSVTDIRGSTISLSGKKIREISFTNPATNANIITITEGASNGHPLFGASWKIALYPGDVCAFKLLDSGQTVVAGGDKTWDVSGTLAQVLQIQLSAG